MFYVVTCISSLDVLLASKRNVFITAERGTVSPSMGMLFNVNMLLAPLKSSILALIKNKHFLVYYVLPFLEHANVLFSFY